METDKKDNYVEIIPYVGAGSFRFGMSPAQIAQLMEREPDSVHPDSMTRRTLYYKHINFIFWRRLPLGKFRLQEIVFADGTQHVTVDGIEVFEDTVAFRRLCSRERPQSGYGFDVFYDLGIMTTGFRNGEEEKTVTAISRRVARKMRRIYEALD